MEKLVEQGKTKHIGVSNFTIGRLEKLLKQVRLAPALGRRDLEGAADSLLLLHLLLLFRRRPRSSPPSTS